MEQCFVMELQDCMEVNQDYSTNNPLLCVFQLQLNTLIIPTMNMFKSSMINKTLHHCLRRSTRKYFIFMNCFFIRTTKRDIVNHIAIREIVLACFNWTSLIMKLSPNPYQILSTHFFNKDSINCHFTSLHFTDTCPYLPDLRYTRLHLRGTRN